MTDASFTKEERSIAYRIVRAHLIRGSIVRPSKCEGCGIAPPPAKDGRSKIQAHHFEGYDAPLSVQWLCAKCHMAVTPNLNTSNQNKGKTHCGRGHFLSEENTYRFGPDRKWRECRICKGENKATFRARAKLEAHT